MRRKLDADTESDEYKILKVLEERERAMIESLLGQTDHKAIREHKLELACLQEEIEDQKQVIKKTVSQSVMDYAKLNKGDVSIQMFARGVNLQDDFYQMCKHASHPKISEALENNPLMLYFKNTQKEGAVSLAMPVLKRVANKALTLINYRISSGICSAMAEAFKGNSKLL